MANNNLISVDVGTFNLKVATYDSQGNLDDIVVHRHHVAPMGFEDETTNVRPSPETPEDAPPEVESVTPAMTAHQKLNELAATGLFTNADVVTVLPSWFKAATVFVETPFVDRDKCENILPHMLSDQLPIDVRRAAYDFQPYPNDGEGAEVVVGFAVVDDVRSYLTTLTTGGIDPVSIGVAPLLLAQYAALYTDSTDFAVLDI